MNSKNFGNKSQMLILFALGVVVFGTFSLVNFKKSKNVPQNQMEQKQKEVTKEIEKQQQVDDVNDGTYTNYQYKFRFKYPENLYKYQQNGSTTVTWTNEINEGGMGPTAVSESAIQLQTSVVDNEVISGVDSAKERYISNFNDLFNLKVKDKSTWGAVKLSQTSKGDQKLVTFYYTNPPEKVNDGTEYYGAWWLKDNYPVVVMEYFAGSKETLLKYKSDFDKIVNSFEFFE